MNFCDKEIIIVGGSGSLGRALVKRLLSKESVKGIRIYSRGELLQHEMRVEIDGYCKNFGIENKTAYLIGDIRDVKRLSMACRGVDYIINAAALKRIEVAEENPLEAIRTNVYGSENVIHAALSNSVEKCLLISTDKAALPQTLYGCSKYLPPSVCS
jgi:UDP-N-acetylglucosamine 4,6-dehydratase